MVFKKKSFFRIGMWHSRPPRDPPPFMAKTILNFHFDYLNPSLISKGFANICHFQNFARIVLFKFVVSDIITCNSFLQYLPFVILTRSSWLNCALRDDEAVYWVSLGHCEVVAVGN